MGWLSAPEAAKKWGVTPQWITSLCRSGLIKGSQKQAGRWLIPDDAPRPFATHEVDDITIEAVVDDRRLRPLPVGVSSFKKIVTEYEYVDKTLLIRDILDSGSQAILFCRPRRFGKTLNMDMLRTFFEKTDENTSVYFKDTLIEGCGQAYMCHQGKYPVVWLSFKDAKGLDWKTCSCIARGCLLDEIRRHGVLSGSNKISEEDRAEYQRLASGELDLTALSRSLITLTRLLHEHYGTAPVVIVDEYDTPIQQGHANGYYKQAVDFMRGLLSGAVKDNPHLTLGCMTGVLRIAKESVFSGLNNMVVRTVLDNQYARHFGFTHDEVRRLLIKRNALKHLDLACSWYDGYQFGEAAVFNPWSILNFIADEYRPAPYWVNTAANDVIRELVEQADPRTGESLSNLLQGSSLRSPVDTSIIYPLLHANALSLYSLLLVSGYLTARPVPTLAEWSDRYELSIPNREVREAFKREVMAYLCSMTREYANYDIVDAIEAGDAAALQRAIGSFIQSTIGTFDTSNEAFYHGLLVGLTAAMQDAYRITSNRESGQGRYDIQLAPKNPRHPGILIEVKALRGNASDVQSKLEALAHAALEQIDERGYAYELRHQGVQHITKFGVAFCKKDVCIEVATEVAAEG